MLKFDCNSVILVNNKNIPFGTRSFGPIDREIRKPNYTNLVSLVNSDIF